MPFKDYESLYVVDPNDPARGLRLFRSRITVQELQAVDNFADK